MYELFENRYIDSGGIYHWPEFDYIRRTYLKELLTVEDYYHSRVYAVKNNHFLQSLLDNLGVPMQYEPYRYVEACRARAPFVSKTLEMTSEIHYGKLHNGIFYGPGSKEIIYSIETWFDIDEVLKNWKNIIPIKPLWHCRSDLDLMLANGKKSGTESGLCAIAIDPVMLSLQYRQFSLDQYKRFSEKNSLLSTSHFIHMFVLPNMMGPHLDLVIINRLLNLFYGKPMGKGLMRHPFVLSNYSSKVDRVLLKILDLMKKQRFSFIELMSLIPSIFHKNTIDTLHMPDLAPTRQVWWAMLVSRLDFMKFLIDIGQFKGDNDLERSSINSLKKQLIQIKRENILEQVLPFDYYFDYKNIIDEILAI